MSERRDIFLFIGPPGAGKGSLSDICTQKLGWEHLSTGNLCRKNIAEQTKIGQEIDFAIKSGKLVSDKLVTSMVADWFLQQVENSQAVVLDGYPRTAGQAEAFDELMRTPRFTFLKLHVVRLRVSDSCVVSRLCNRYICQNKECQHVYSLAENSPCAPKKGMICDYCSQKLGRRADDTQQAVQERLHVYYKHEKALLDFYMDRGYDIMEVYVEKPLNEIFEQFVQMVGVIPV